MPTLSPTCRLFALVAVTLAAAALCGCMSAQGYREKADDVAGEIIHEGQQAALGETEPFTIDTAERTLRRRLLEIQQLAVADDVSRGSDALEPIDHWPDDDYLDRDRPQPREVVDVEPNQPVALGLTDALQVAAFNSREYQSQKESVFQTALALDLQRNAFRNTYAGLINQVFTSELDADAADQTGIVTSPEVGVERQLQSGISLASRIIVDLAQMVRPDGAFSEGLFVDFSVTIPLLAGSGEHIVAEPLTQAQRNVLYALWDFDRFKRTFAVQVASDYLNVLQQLDRVDNARGNYERLIDSAQRSRALADAGRLSEIEVDQINQDVLSARDQWIAAQESYARQLDQYKITLGLPTDARIELKPAELRRLAERGREAMGADEAADAILAPPTADANDGQPRTASDRFRGRLELPETDVVRIALERRRDLRVRIEQVDDAKRDVVVAADALRPGLTLRGGGSFGDRRGVGSTDQPRAELRPETGSYNASLAFDFPWEKTPERNDYRNALIALEASVRDVQALEDQIKLALRNALRQLRQTRESFAIQARAVQLAERRVASTKLFLQAGRAEIRDVLDAEESLLDAQDALTDALVSYRVAELELQRDMGVLEVNQEGLWREYVAE